MALPSSWCSETSWKPASRSPHFCAGLAVVDAGSSGSESVHTWGLWSTSCTAVRGAELTLTLAAGTFSLNTVHYCVSQVLLFSFSCLLFQEPRLYCCGNADREAALGRVRSHGSHLQNRHPTNQPPAPLPHIRTLPGLSKADLCGSQAQTLC